MREYHLARQGHEQQLHRRRREEAAWMAPLYSVYAEEPVTVAQLLGEPEDGPSAEEAAAAAQSQLEAIQAAMRKRKERA